jgi:glycosyltransferase involved in cell wall biosynthesis
VVEAVSPGPAPAVHVLGAMLGQDELPALYAGCDAFVLASRGEGWGRPVHEAMLMGLPVVGTQAGALLDLLPDAALGFPVRSRLAPVSAAAAAQTPVFTGQQWWEPDGQDLQARMQEVARDRESARARGLRARQHVLAWCAHEPIARRWRELLAATAAGTGRGRRQGEAAVPPEPAGAPRGGRP